ncbi:unnamed protein product [Hermetia illucens]|uniref:Uncharacterized protein n=1 Tax=Hermetia illucens TaxID=343691 RepID=A0A7R8YX96_HERIL|nr:F-box/LRR-repeat protein 4-like isoform X3 [Hermetia illucens]CAD7088773.1 unnamed protein product [Hermetia illucens]
MTSEASISVLDDYCLEHIFSFLEILDQYNIGKAYPEFKAIIKRIIGKDLFIFNELCGCTSLPEATEFLTEYGPAIKKILLTLGAVQKTHDFYFLIPTHCHNIEEFQYYFPYPLDDKMMEMTFEASKNIKVLYWNQSQLSDDQSLLISNLKELESLDIEMSGEITGLHLNKLTKLKELNIEGCGGFTSEHFIDLCKATKLKRLNIIDCLSLDQAAFDALLKTQTDLEEIAINRCYQKANVNLLVHLPNLRRVHISWYSHKAGVETDLVNLLAQHHSEALQTLQIYSPENLSETKRAGILKMINLRRLSLIKDGMLDDEFLKKISRRCSKLEAIDIRYSMNVTVEGIIELVKNLKDLCYLDLRSCELFDDSLYPKLVEVKRNCQGSKSLKVFVSDTGLKEESFRDSADYLALRRFVELSFDTEE